MSLSLLSPRADAPCPCAGCEATDAAQPLFFAPFDTFDPASLIRSELALDGDRAARFRPRVLRGYAAGPLGGFILCGACYETVTGQPPDATSFSLADGEVEGGEGPRVLRRRELRFAMDTSAWRRIRHLVRWSPAPRLAEAA